MNLRSSITAVPTVIGTIRAELGFGPTAISLLTSIPVLCFGLLTPLASALIARLGIYRAILLTLGGVALGTLLRSLDGMSGMLVGTLLIGAVLTVGNIVSVQVIARDFPQRMGSVTSIYAASMGIGTMVTSSLTAPLAGLAGWRIALASWVWMPLAAIPLWLWVERLRREAHLTDSGRTMGTSAAAVPHARPVWRIPEVWLLSVALIVHQFDYYGITAWLPTYLTERTSMTANEAGLGATAFQVLGMLGAFSIPVLVRHYPLHRVMVVMGLLWMATPLAIYLAPSHWLVWSILAGVPQGGTFVTIFMLIMRSARNLDENRRLSMVVQGAGYAFASLGPIIIGYLREQTGFWRAPFLLMGVLPLVIVTVGMTVGRLRERQSA